LFGRTRSALLALFYGRTGDSFYLRQLARETGAGHGALQRELKKLTDMGLVVRSRRGNQVLYQANPKSPIFLDIKSLVAKTVGVRDVLRKHLAELGSRVKLALVYGSVARQQERTNSDVDVMVVGSASFAEVVSALRPAQQTLGREINPTVFPGPEFRAKLATGNYFLRGVMSGKKLFVIGTQNELRKLAAK
jgi:predicted nucleotidyltransferase